MAAARAMLDEIHGDLPNRSSDLNSYVFGAIGNHYVAMACLPYGIYGTTPAALVVCQMQLSFPSIRFYMMVGIGGGIPTKTDIRLGDVVVSVPTGQCPGVVQHDRGRIVVGGHTEQTGNLHGPPRGLLNVVSKLRAIHSSDGNRIFQLLEEAESKLSKKIGFIRPKEDDILFRAGYDHIDSGSDTCDYCDEHEALVRSSRDTHDPVVHYGIIASGNTVIKDGKSRDLIGEKNGAYCFEMEAAGVADVVECLVIRGICDYSDSHKNKRWQPYAAATSAGYAKELLQTLSTKEQPIGRPPNNSAPSKFHNTIEGGDLEDNLLDMYMGALKKSGKLTRLLAEEEYKIQSLRTLSFGGMDFRLNNIALAHQTTCDWFFKTKEFLQWRNRENVETFNGVLWIKGKPGAGKSTLMKHTLLYCRREIPSHSIAAYFFSTRGQGLEKSRYGMLRSLLYQICDNDSGAYRAFLQRFRDKEKKHAYSWEWREDELEAITLESVASSTKPVVLLVDALDECDESEVRMVVNFLETLSSVTIASAKNSLNVCLSSRHYPTISMAKKLDLTIEGIAGHNKDIAIYVEAKLRIDNNDIKYELCKKAEGLFMWVILVVGLLNRAYDDGDIDAVWIRLRELPPDLDAVFSTLLEIDNPEKHQTIFMLEFMLFRRGRLAPIELYYAVKAGTKPESLRRHDTSTSLMDKIIKNFIINHSRGLIEVCGNWYYGDDSDTRVQFIHKTVEDFLLRNNRLQTLHSRMAPDFGGFGDEGIAFSCLEYLRMKDLAKEPSLESIPDVEIYLNRNYPFLKYAAENIFYHSEKAESGHQKIITQLINTPERELVHELISVCDIFRHDIPGRSRYQCSQDASLLYAVSIQNYPKLVQTVLTLPTSYDVNANAPGGYYGTPLQAAVSIQANDIIQLLLDAGADLNITAGNYFHVLQTAIHCAPMSDEDEVLASTLSFLAKLIGAGADVNANGGEFGTALQAAAAIPSRLQRSRYSVYYTMIKIIRMLLDAGADVNVQGGLYGNALQAAVESIAHASGGDKEPAKEVIKMLLEAGADVNAQGGLYGNVLQATAGFMNVSESGDHFSHELTKILLDAGSDVNAQGGLYGSALCAACAISGFAPRQVEVAKSLLSAGADVNAQIGSQKYNTPLALACGGGWTAYDLVETLLSEGADVNARSRNGSAVDAAFRRGCLDAQDKMLNIAMAAEGPFNILRRLQLAGAIGAAEAEQKLKKYRDWVLIQVSKGRKRSELPYDLYLQETSRPMSTSWLH
ncbi:hypothetical protein AOL_s00076g106 [Orbilia oligospora ATCC 24927]|uniref:Nephrocystin 3-like N-terminal domain-containing protein n=1 Tax=Arthrobotrys oligospora (strain ATCC 24927 / CBS 115.81 / DSM 1491) TaxID=756982 RepID=G1X8Z9_ARTOA|nr:hypothetical protein AOL_s00076g106 [Orbilia oligospora ATCC 24927]EGX50342.1 hypothetical protein AOL_s00076g106 [Orbilia oligospora ATCC 24927]